MAEDVLYVVAQPVRGDNEVHWVPTSSPESARVLVEGLRNTASVYQYEDELWWMPQTTELAEKADLVGQNMTAVPGISIQGHSRMVRYGELVFSVNFSSLFRSNLRTGETKELEGFRFGRSFLAFAIHEDRVYFGSRTSIDSIRIDGADRRVELVNMNAQALAANGKYLYGGGSQLWRWDLVTREMTVLESKLPHQLVDMAATDDGLYWIGDNTVWRRLHGTREDEEIYALGDTALKSVCVMNVIPHPVEIAPNGKVIVQGEPGSSYQVLYSNDLRTWSPNLFGGNLFHPEGVLRWLSPRMAESNEPLVWFPRALEERGFYAAWRYDFTVRGDSDLDGLPDYWERRYFGDLSSVGESDPDLDGLTNFEEVAVFTSPTAPDSDGDGLTDSDEVRFEPGLNPTHQDSDGDGLADGDEVRVYQTNPGLVDTDGDGFADNFELEHGAEPNNSTSTPDRALVLDSNAEDLMVHFTFDTMKDGAFVNAGVLGGSAIVRGPALRIVDSAQTATSSPAIQLGEDPSERGAVTWLETSLGLAGLGIAAADAEYTISFWLQPQSRVDGTLLSVASPHQSVGDVLGTDRSPLGVRITSLLMVAQRGGQSVGTMPFLSTGVWHHFAWTRHPEAWKQYVDGNLVFASDSIVMDALEGDVPLSIGAISRKTFPAGNVLTSRPFLGAIDELRIYRKALPQSAILSLVDNDND